MTDEPHIGKMIKRHLINKGIRIGWLAERLGCHRNNIYKMMDRAWMDTQTLMRISLILEHDFFSELSEAYEKEAKTIHSPKSVQNAH